MSADVFKMNEEELEIVWDVNVVMGVESVDIVVYSYHESLEDGAPSWSVAARLASNLSFTEGGASIEKSEVHHLTENGSDVMGVIGVTEVINNEKNGQR